MREKTRVLMLELAERMLKYAQDRPRWPGSAAKPKTGNKEFFASLDESVNRNEVAYWENRVAHYSKVRTRS